MDIKAIAVIGAGTMGSGIARVLAASGIEVTMTDVSDNALQRGVAAVSGSLDRLLGKQKITENDKQAVLGRIQRENVEAGHLGRKSGRGFFIYLGIK